MSHKFNKTCNVHKPYVIVSFKQVIAGNKIPVILSFR